MVRQVNINMDEEMLEKMDELIKRGVYATRSELIRDAVRQLLLRFFTFEGR